MARHNKKRNVGLIYEQLIYRLTKALVEGDDSTVTTIKTIMSERFKKGTELYKEFRLFNALVKTGNATDQLAFRIIDEAKKASIDHDPIKLDREKSLLIRDINHGLNESNFYDKKIENYQVYASAQQLFNMWRSPAGDITEVARHEATVHNWLMRENSEEDLDSYTTQNVNDLTVKIMQEKLESKFGSSFSDRQNQIIRLYCEGKYKKLQTIMLEVQAEIDNLVKSYKKNSKDKFLLEKVVNTHSVIKESKFSSDVESVSKIMLLDQLVNELEGITNVR